MKNIDLAVKLLIGGGFSDQLAFSAHEPAGPCKVLLA
jgi:hypothetical protein